MLLTSTLDLTNPIGIDLVDLNEVDSFTIDETNVGSYFLAIGPSSSGTYSATNAEITKDGSVINWTAIPKATVYYIGPLEVGTYSISTVYTNIFRNLYLSKVIPELVSQKDNISTSSPVKIPDDNTGYNYLHLGAYGNMTGKYSAKFGARQYLIKKGVTELVATSNVTTNNASILLKFPKDLNKSIEIKNGDVFTVNENILFNLFNANVKVELYGTKGTTFDGIGGNGGYTSFILETKNLENPVFSFNTRGDLLYGETSDLYYRIAVAGDGGSGYYTGTGGAVKSPSGAGGGITGGSTNYSAYGGTQTTGGSKRGSNGDQTSGSFGNGGYGGKYISSSSRGGYGGYGWYGGGGGGYSSSWYNGGGGSGFIIGTSTTTYPAGYLGDDTTLQTNLASAISEGVLTQGGSTEESPKMVLTIIESRFKLEGSVQSITASGMTTDFEVGDEYKFDGSVVANWSNGTRDVTDKCTITQPNMNTSGKKTITISYTDDTNITVTTSFIINVVKIERISFDYTGAVQTMKLQPGKYKLQVWGAQGGSYSTSYQGGYGGYSEGVLTLTQPTDIFIYVGGQPKSYSSGTVLPKGGFNGGGNGAYAKYSYTTYHQAGGGGSDIRIGSDSLYARVIVAGGGAGGSNSYNALTGRYGGGTTGGAYNTTYQATQTTGYSFGVGQSGYSASNYNYGSSGSGGGWYGGKSYQGRSDSTNYSSYTSGGSGYVYTETTAGNYPSGCLLNPEYYLTEASTKGYSSTAAIPSTTDDTVLEVGHSGNGYAKITILSTTPTASLLQYFNGTSFIPTNINYYNGTEFQLCDAYYFDGTEFKKI